MNRSGRTGRHDVDQFLRFAPPQLAPEVEQRVLHDLYRYRIALFRTIMGSPAGLSLIWAHGQIARHHPRAASAENAAALDAQHHRATELLREGRLDEVAAIVGSLRPQLRDIRGMEAMLLATADRGLDWVWPAERVQAAAAKVRRLRPKVEARVQVLVRHNLRLVVHLASLQAYPVEDLLQEASLGLWDGAWRYDPTVGAKFSTYAGWWIRKRVGRWMDRRRSPEDVGAYEDVAESPIPAPVVDLEPQRLADALLAELPEDQARALRLRYGVEGPEMSVKEVAKEMGVKPRNVVAWTIIVDS